MEDSKEKAKGHKKKNNHAIIIGGSIAGCLAAEVLSPYFDKVTLLEKGDFEDEVNPRKSVPQERHIHVLLQKGEKIMERIFPNLMHDLKAEGAVNVNLGQDIEWFQYGLWKKRYDMNFESHFFSRRLLDNCIRRRIRQNTKIRILSQSSVEDFIFSVNEKEETTVVGVKIHTLTGITSLHGNLVVDARGLGSQTPTLLKSAGLGEVYKEKIKTNLGYVTRLYKRDPQSTERTIVVWSTPPKEKALGLMLPIENDRWMVSVGGWFNQFPKPESEDFLNYTRTILPVSNIYDRIKDLEPLDDIVRYRLPYAEWRHFEKLAKFPDGLLVIGAALCTTNPFYGQGMTLCAIQAELIQSTISGWIKGRYSTHYIQSSFTKIVQFSWDMAKTEDLRFPEIVGRRTPFITFKQWYSKKFARIAALTPFARKMQLDIIHMIKPTYWAFHPKIIIQMILFYFKRIK